MVSIVSRSASRAGSSGAVFDRLAPKYMKPGSWSEFSPPQTEIVVAVRWNANFGECSIRDQGPGFTHEDKTRMFHRYARLSARPTGSEPSTGLGLSIVRKLVDVMEGELICESVPGAGATFIVRLPAAKSS